MSKNISNPWTTLSTRTAYDNPWISIEENAVIQPDGNNGIYGVVRLKNKAMGILPIDSDGYVYLVGQYRYALNLYSWEIPEGGCPEGEDPLLAAQRELLEETGLTASNWELLLKSHTSNCVTDEEALIYLATNLMQGEAKPDATEVLDIKRISFIDVLTMVKAGEITDAMSTMAIMHYALFKAKAD